MPIYEWRCTVCRHITETLSRDPSNTFCEACASTALIRKYSLSVVAGDLAFTPHFNHSIGKVVRSSKEFDSELSRAGDAAGTTYSRLDLRDRKMDADAAGIAEQEKTHRDSGKWEETGIGKPAKRTVL